MVFSKKPKSAKKSDSFEELIMSRYPDDLRDEPASLNIFPQLKSPRNGGHEKDRLSFKQMTALMEPKNKAKKVPFNKVKGTLNPVAKEEEINSEKRQGTKTRKSFLRKIKGDQGKELDKGQKLESETPVDPKSPRRSRASGWSESKR